MLRAIFYKEWIKTGWYWLLALLASTGFAGYVMLRVARVCELKGVEHLWETMLQRDAVFIDMLQYVPLIIGLGLAVVQFVPEMQRKCLKLTLHLPVKAYRATGAMLLFGTVMLIAAFVPAIALMYFYLRSILAPELYSHILLTAAPWYAAGVAAYLLTAWISLEPTWRQRTVDAVIALLLLRIYFLAPAPEAYNRFMPVLFVATLLLAALSMLSITRFRDGRQD